MIVCDTSVVSYIFNGDPRGDYYKDQIRGERVVISFQTLEELRFGMHKGNWGDRRRDELDQHLQQYAIIWPNPELVDTCARLRSSQENLGRRLEIADAWIAATAVMLNCPLASHDRDFSDIDGLEIVRAQVR